jgi:sarcosine oxidase, subunit beta
VDIIQNCAVTGIRRDGDGAIEGVETNGFHRRTRKVGVSRPGNSSVVMQMAGCGCRWKAIPCRRWFRSRSSRSFPASSCRTRSTPTSRQSDKGELVIGAGTDQYTSYSQRGALHVIEHTVAAICELFPIFRRMRMLRNWGGIVDVTPDRSPILARPGAGALRQLRLGHRRLQGDARAADLLAYTIARDEPHPINAPFTLDRFRNGD